VARAFTKTSLPLPPGQKKLAALANAALALVGTVAYPLLMGGVDRMAVSEGPFEILLGALVSVWLGAVALFLCHELGDL
jgi:hypothetical protein